MSSGLRVGDWHPFRCGDQVTCRQDPRHCGRVEQVLTEMAVRVTWEGGAAEVLPWSKVGLAFWDMDDDAIMQVYRREVAPVADADLDPYAQAVLDECARRARVRWGPAPASGMWGGPI